MITAVVPPIVADESDRAVINAPLTLLTAPIDGEIETLSARLDQAAETGGSLARISNARLDRSTLISLEEKAADAREKLQATQAKGNSDRTYIASLDAVIAGQTAQLKTQFRSQIAELKALVAASESVGSGKKALVERQTGLVQRNTASMDMLKPTIQEYGAAQHKAEAERAKLNHKIEQLSALENDVYVGDDLIALGALVQKRRDVDLDAQRMAIEERELSAVLQDKQRLIDSERRRLDRLAEAEVRIPAAGKIVNVSAMQGRHVNAGDSIASLLACDRRFVVAIFSYRQGQSMTVGTEVRIAGAPFNSGVVTEVLPKTSDKGDERFAVPFPQTERRELYAIIAPGEGTGAQTAAETPPSDCNVGQWVTVTKDNGIVPSMSVTWSKLERLVTSWGGEKANDEAVIQRAGMTGQRHEAGPGTLSAAFRFGRKPKPEADTDSRADTVVPR